MLSASAAALALGPPALMDAALAKLPAGFASTKDTTKGCVPDRVAKNPFGARPPAPNAKCQMPNAPPTAADELLWTGPAPPLPRVVSRPATRRFAFLYPAGWQEVRCIHVDSLLPRLLPFWFPHHSDASRPAAVGDLGWAGQDVQGRHRAARVGVALHRSDEACEAGGCGVAGRRGQGADVSSGDAAGASKTRGP